MTEINNNYIKNVHMNVDANGDVDVNADIYFDYNLEGIIYTVLCLAKEHQKCKLPATNVRINHRSDVLKDH